MWQDFSAHHYQRGDVTAVVWGAPGAPPPEGESAYDDICGRLSSSTLAAGLPSAPTAVDAEALTRGRRAETPFVQQCDFVFPLPDRESSDSDDDRCSHDKEKTAEQRAEAFVVRSLGKAFYYRAQGPLSALLREPFLGSCVLKGGFSALALNAPSDQGNSFAILPDGVLVLSLDRESFQTLGLPGKAAPTRPSGKGKRAGAGAGSTGGSAGVLGGGAGGPDRYVSAFHLASKAFRPGKPLHDRVLSCLEGGGGGCGRGKGEEDSSFVDMVVCWWGKEGVDSDLGQDRVEDEGHEKNWFGGGTQDSPRNSGLSAEEVGFGEHSRESAAGGGSDEKSKSGSNVKSVCSMEQRQPRQCCREIAFPPGFSAERIDLKPDIRFFREACCPDLGFVEQGFAATNRGGERGADAVEDDMAVNEASPTSGEGSKNDTSGGGSNSTADRNAEKRSDRANLAGLSSLTTTSLRPAPPPTTKCLLMLDMFEWLGAVACGLDAVIQRDPSPPEPHLSEFETPRHLCFRRSRVLCRARLRGLLPPLAVSGFVKAAGLAAGSASAVSAASSAEDRTQHKSQLSERPDGCSWGAVTAWPFRDAPRAYPGADARCAGGQRSKRGGGIRKGDGKIGLDGSRGGNAIATRNGLAERSTKEWPVGGHGVYSVVACPGETAVAYVSAKCPGPGW